MSISGKCTRTDELAQAGMRSGRPPARINTDCGFADPRGKGFAEGAKGALDVLGPDPTRLAIGLGSEPLTGLIGPERPKGAEAELGEHLIGLFAEFRRARGHLAWRARQRHRLGHHS